MSCLQVTSGAGHLSRSANLPSITTAMSFIFWKKNTDVEDNCNFWSLDDGAGTWTQLGAGSTSDSASAWSSGGSIDPILTSVSTRGWICFAGVRSAANTLQIYYRYDADQSMTLAGSLAGVTNAPGLYLFTSGFAEQAQNMKITPYKEWNANLTPTQLLTESKFREPQVLANLNNYLPCQSVSGTDRSGAGHNWTITGTLTLDSDKPASMYDYASGSMIC